MDPDSLPFPPAAVCVVQKPAPAGFAPQLAGFDFASEQLGRKITDIAAIFINRHQGSVGYIQSNHISGLKGAHAPAESQFDTLPKDTSASIYTAGLLGEKYIGLEAGGDEVSLKNGDELKLTQDSLVLEKLIGQFVSKFLEDKDAK